MPKLSRFERQAQKQSKEAYYKRVVEKQEGLKFIEDAREVQTALERSRQLVGSSWAPFDPRDLQAPLQPEYWNLTWIDEEGEEIKVDLPSPEPDHTYYPSRRCIDV